ncbi:MAG: hypothetical protein AAF567_11290 [Actinomycetota bacterium]
MSDATAEAKPAPTEFPEPERFDYSAFPCPRCGATMSAETYRPCDACMTDLKATQRGEGGQSEAAAYEPKMNVTPNAVALKDD